MKQNILVRGARQLLTLHGPSGPRRGAALGNLGLIEDGAVLVVNGLVSSVGPSRRVENLAEARTAMEINATGRVVMPGFIDCHAHIYSEDETKYPTMEKPYRPPAGKGTLTHLRQQMKAAGVRRAVAVHTFTFYRFDNRFVADACRDNRDIISGVCLLNADDPQSVRDLERYARDFNVRGLLEWAKVDETTLKAGKYKDTLSPFRPLQDTDREEIQSISDDIYGQFVKAVAEGRGLPEAKVREIADMVRERVGDNVEIVVTPTDDHRSYHVSSAKIHRELGFEAKRTVGDVLADFGWPETVDIGGIEGSRELEAICIVWVKIGGARGAWDHGFKLLVG